MNDHARLIPSRPRELDSVQGLRGIAASMVLFYHLARTELDAGRSDVHILRPFLYFGAEGVDLFFVISGFIILWTNFDRFGAVSYIPKYLARRAARIFPLYWFYLAFAILSAAIGLNHAVAAASGRWNMVGITFLLPLECVHIVPVSWTLTFELWFYAVFAFTLFFRRRFFLPLLAAWFVMVCVHTGLTGHGGDSPSLLARILNVVVHFRTTEFMAGCLVAMALRSGRRLPPKTTALAGALVFALAGFRLWQLDPGATGSVWQVELIALFGLGAAGIVTGSVCQELKVGARFVPRWLVRLGDVSYSLYLAHLFAFAVIRRFADRLNSASLPGHMLWLLVLATGGFAAGFLSYHFLERPMLSVANRAIKRLLAPPAGSAL
jgi:exopolysaccharide production protein ExoZ